jgi:hypothetical protein
MADSLLLLLLILVSFTDVFMLVSCLLLFLLFDFFEFDGAVVVAAVMEDCLFVFDVVFEFEFEYDVKRVDMLEL